MGLVVQGMHPRLLMWRFKANSSFIKCGTFVASLYQLSENEQEVENQPQLLN